MEIRVRAVKAALALHKEMEKDQKEIVQKLELPEQEMLKYRINR